MLFLLLVTNPTNDGAKPIFSHSRVSPMKWIDASNGPSMLDLGSNGVFDRTCKWTRELIRMSSLTSVVLEEEDWDEEAFHCSKLSSSLDVRWTDAFVLVVGLRGRVVVVAHEKKRLRVVDGSCGYHCMMLLLCGMKLIEITLSVTQFCRGILEFIESNMIKFIGVSSDGNDAVF